MPAQQVKGNAAQMRVPTASNARNILQNVENLFNLALVTRVFEDASIASSKVVGGVGGVFNYTAQLGLYGDNNLAVDVGNNSIQIGGAVATGNESVVIGATVAYKSTAGAFGVAIGSYAQAAGSSAIAIGVSATATPNASVAIGSNADATIGVGAISIGNTNSSATAAISIGNICTASANDALAIGNSVGASAAGAVAIGQNFTNSTIDSFAFGNSNTNKITWSDFTPAVSAATASTHSLDIVIGATTYKILLSNI